MDYDQSKKYPEDVSLRRYRRPECESWVGADVYRPHDVFLGEPTYNPFAFDVAMLGNLFRVQFSVWQHLLLPLHLLTPCLQEAMTVIPALAAMFDRMTTHVHSQRFTAQEARNFLREEIHLLPCHIITAALDLIPQWLAMTNSGIYWSKVPPHLQGCWRHYRTPPPSWWLKVLTWIMKFPICCRIIVFVRRAVKI